VLGDLLAGVFVLATGTFVLCRALAPFSRIWSGDERAAASLPRRWWPVKARNYLAYLLWVVPGTSGISLVGLSMVLSAAAPAVSNLGLGIGVTGLLLFGLAVLALPVHVVVSLTNRPGFLVPPPYRDQVGVLAAARHRRTERKARPSGAYQR
jgi:hypothetical protein